MIKIQNRVSVIFGILLVLIIIMPAALGSQISLITIYVLLFGLYSILNGILDHKTEILYVLLGFTTLVFALIGLMIQKASSFDVAMGIIIGIGSIILGIGVLLNFLPKKWVQWY